MVEMPTQSRGGVKGGGLRPFSSAPCGVWGNAPTVPRATDSKGKANKGAGSEASLPVTLRFLRSAPKLLYSPLAHWRDHAAGLVDMACLFCKQRISPLRRRQGGFAVAPLTPSQCTPMFLDFDCCRGIRACGRDKGGSDGVTPSLNTVPSAAQSRPPSAQSRGGAAG